MICFPSRNETAHGGSESTYLELNLSLGNILFATATASNLLGLGNLAADGLGAEVLEGVCLGGVDA